MAKIESYEDVYGINKSFLEKVGSPTACAAKWFQSTLHLQNGLTQSCYNTPQHKIDLEQVKDSPKALHNTSEKAGQRKQMLKGKRPKGCEYCWRIEDQNSNALSDRHNWNFYLSKENGVTEVADFSPSHMFNPKVIEVSFSNTCNFMCGYCHPKNSSRFYNEIKRFGKYEGNSHQCGIDSLEIYEEDNNPFLDAFWRWWPEMSKDLKVIRLTGGEPLVQKSTERLFEALLESPRPNLILAINTNLGMSPKLFKKHVRRIKQLLDTGSINRVEIFTSLDTWGEQAQYIRHGLDLEIFKENMDFFLATLPNQLIAFMVTFNIFSLPRFTQLMQYWLELKNRYNQNGFNRIRVNLNILTEPIVFSYLLLPESFALPAFDQCLQFANQHFDSTSINGFSNLMESEIKKVRNDYILNRLAPKNLKQARRSFMEFFRQYDERKEMSLLKTFPEFKDIVSDW